MNDWGDTKRLIFEDLLVYGGLIILTLGFDLLVNLSVAVNLHSLPHEPHGHPYQIGAIQIVVLIFSAIQVFRRGYMWKFYK